MSDVTILTILKFAGVIIALATTVWGMTRKTTFEDDEGRKRLTPAGHVAVALALGSFLVATASQGFETLAKQGEAQEQALKDAKDAREKEAKAARDFRNEQRVQRSLDLQQLNRAEARAARTEQRLLTLKAAEEQRERDLALSHEVSLGAQQNLKRAQLALTQLERLMQPIEGIDVTTEWAIVLDPSNPDLLALRRAVEHTGAARPPGLRVERSSDGSISTVTIDRSSEFYDRLSGFRNSNSYLCFFAEGAGNKGCPSDAGLAIETATDGAFEKARIIRSGIQVDLVCRTVSPGVVMKMPREMAVDKNGEIASILDLKKASIVLKQSWSFKGAHLKPVQAIIRVSGGRYVLFESDFKSDVDASERIFTARLPSRLGPREENLSLTLGMDMGEAISLAALAKGLLDTKRGCK